MLDKTPSNRPSISTLRALFRSYCTVLDPFILRNLDIIRTIPEYYPWKTFVDENSKRLRILISCSTDLEESMRRNEVIQFLVALVNKFPNQHKLQERLAEWYEENEGWDSAIITRQIVVSDDYSDSRLHQTLAAARRARDEEIMTTSVEAQEKSNPALYHAAECGKTEVKTPLGKDAGVNVQGGKFSNALEIASYKGAFDANENIDDAIEFWKMRVTSDRNDGNAMVALQIAFREKGNIDDAIEFWKMRVTSDRNDGNAMVALQGAFTEKGNIDDAIVFWKMRVTSDPNDRNAMVALQNAFREKGNIDDAIEFWKMRVTSDRNDGNAMVALQIALREKGNIDDAIEFWKMRVTSDPNDGNARVALQGAFTEKGNIDDAIVFWKMRVTSDPNDGNARVALQGAFTEKGNIDDAIVFWKMRVTSDPNDRNAMAALQSAFREKGNIDDARSRHHPSRRI